jgi:hypothetical protein
MPEPKPFLSLGLNAPPEPAPAQPSEQLPAPESLQFRRAEHGPEPSQGRQRCLACSQPIADTYFQVQGKVVCPACAKTIEARTMPPPAHSLFKAFLYGLGAAIAGCAIYATVAIVTGLQLSLISILIGYMVGKSILHASRGLGGRPQQILAVLLTYFAITTSYIPVGIYTYVKQHRQQPAADSDAPAAVTPDDSVAKQHPTAALITGLLLLTVAAPFMGLSHATGLLSLLIIFFGLQYACRLTARRNIVIMGPYQAGASA